jgi:nucleotide-binding universal stress UspA family protein
MAQRGRVVVGVSGSLRSLAALHRAVDEARRRDAELMAVLAWAPPGGEAGYRRNFSCATVLAALEDAAGGRLRQAFSDAFGGEPPGVRLRLVTARGEAATALVALADRPDDLLVVSTGRRGGFQRLFHGGVARHCLAHARCTVLAVPPSELMRDLGRTTGVLDELRLRDAA